MKRLKMIRLSRSAVPALAVFALALDAKAATTTCTNATLCTLIQQYGSGKALEADNLSTGRAFVATAQSGTAVDAISFTGDAVIGDARSEGNTGTGVTGLADKGDGVEGRTFGRNKSGVYGVHEDDEFGYGVYGRVAGSGSGTGVSGYSANGYGVEGRTTSPNYAGVLAFNTSTTGGYGLFAYAPSPGWAGYFSGKVFATSYSSSSDARLKKEITDVRDGLGPVLALRPVTFKWTKEMDDLRHVGLIAQEVQKVVPEIVSADESSGMLSVEYTALVPLMLKAVQEQQQLIQKQGERIAELERGRGPVLSSMFSGGVGQGLAFCALPLGIFLALRRKKQS